VLNSFFPYLQGPDYRLYKSEPELTTVAEVDESNGEERCEHPSDRDHSGNKGTSPRITRPVYDNCAVLDRILLAPTQTRLPDDIINVWPNKLVSSTDSCHGYHGIYSGITLTQHIYKVTLLSKLLSLVNISQSECHGNQYLAHWIQIPLLRFVFQ